jgi:antitoxin component YwqK of YwqJK toxin-antitoxin module
MTLAALIGLALPGSADAARRKKEPPPLTFPRVEWRTTQYAGGKLETEWQVLLKSADESARHGIFRRYHENGRVALLGYYRDNEPAGVWTWLDNRGNILRQTRQRADYDDEITGQEARSAASVFRNPAGIPTAEGMMKADVPHGHWVFYHPDGTPKAEGSYVTGAADGGWNYYHPNGQIDRKMRFVLGVPNGEFRSAYDNGQERELGRYDQGVRAGQWRTWFADGQIHEEGAYVEDRREGEWRTWSTEGRLMRRTRYRDGKVAEELPVPRLPTPKESLIPDIDRLPVPPHLYDENGSVIRRYDDEYVPPPPRGKKRPRPVPLTEWRNANQAGQ